MSQPAVSALASLPFELVTSDGEPLETNWHVIQMNLLIDLIYEAMTERGRTDFFAGGDMFVYYAYEQARDIAAGRPYFRGPDVFYVGGVEGWARAQGLGRLGGGRTPARRHRRAPVAVDREDRPDDQEGSLCPLLPHAGVLPVRARHLEVRRVSAQGGSLSAPDAQCSGAALERRARTGARPVVRNASRAGSQLAAPLPSRRPPRADRGRARRSAKRQRADAAEAELKRLRALLEDG